MHLELRLLICGVGITTCNPYRRLWTGKNKVRGSPETALDTGQVSHLASCEGWQEHILEEELPFEHLATFWPSHLLIQPEEAIC